MKIDNLYSNENFMAQFLAKQDLPKPAQNPISELASQPQKDTFELSSAKENNADAPKQSDDSFVKAETVEKPEAPQTENAQVQEPEKMPEAPQTEEVKEEPQEEPKEEVSEEKAEQDENVKKKTKFIDKIKGFFKNLFIKKKPNDENTEAPRANTSNSSAN